MHLCAKCIWRDACAIYKHLQGPDRVISCTSYQGPATTTVTHMSIPTITVTATA